MNKRFRFIKAPRAAIATSIAVVGFAANAAVDTTSLTAVTTDITAVGAAVFVVFITIKGIKWVRRAL